MIYLKLFDILKLIYIKLLNKYCNNLLAKHFGIKKSQKLIFQKYYLSTLQAKIKSYINGSNMYLTLKIIKYKSYINL